MIDHPQILHIDTGKAWRGGQKQAVSLFEGLLKRGIKTTFVCKPSSALKHYFVRKSLPFFEARLSSELDVFSALKIARLCRKKGFNILHLHTSHALSLGLLAKLFCPQLKLIAVRRVDFPIRNNVFSKIKYSTQKLDRIVTISGGIRSVLLSCGIDAKKIELIHSGIDLQRFKDSKIDEEFKNKYNPKNKNVIGTVAAFADHKDYPNLLKAAKIVLGKRKDVIFIALGSGRQEEKIYTIHKALNLKNGFIFMGFKENVGSFLKLFDIFVLSSKQEGLGTSILDAQTVGLPVVATNVGGIPEAVASGENGLLVPSGDPQKLAEAILKMVEDRSLRVRLGKNGKKSVKRFSIKTTIEKNIALYYSLSNSKTAKQ